VARDARLAHLQDRDQFLDVQLVLHEQAQQTQASWLAEGLEGGCGVRN
jgi:hypothetical protein